MQPWAFAGFELKQARLTIGSERTSLVFCGELNVKLGNIAPPKCMRAWLKPDLFLVISCTSIVESAFFLWSKSIVCFSRPNEQHSEVWVGSSEWRVHTSVRLGRGDDAEGYVAGGPRGHS